MANLNNDEINKAIELLKEQARVQQDINSSLDSYLNYLKKIKLIDKTISDNKKTEEKLQKDLLKAKKSNDKKSIETAEFKLKILKQENDELERQNEIFKKNAEGVNKVRLLGAKFGSDAIKTISQLPNLFKMSYGRLKGYGLFEMDKAMKKSALQMGILSNQTDSFRNEIKDSALETLKVGVGIEELSQMQSNYSDELGRTVVLGKEGLTAMANMASATILGAEGAAKMAAEMENQGYSAKKTSEFVEETMASSHKMGLNASKVIKNIQNNIKLLNKYNFKNGINGLAKMAQITAKLGVNMEFAGNMAEKLFDIEGAVDMSAQLQTMGGEWSKLADPFKLMYMARNDMAGLTEALGSAAASAAHFNKEGSDFEISALEMHRLRKIAEQTGVSYEELAQAGKNARKFSEIKGQISFKVDDNDLKEYLTNTAVFEKGKAYITLNGDKKLLSALSNDDKNTLKKQMLQRSTLKNMAEKARTFDDALNNTASMLKVSLLPFIEELNSKLIPKIDGFVKRLKDEKWFDRISDIAKSVGSFVSTVGGFIIDNPIKAALISAIPSVAKLFFNTAEWIRNGMLLSQGFNMGTINGPLTTTIGTQLKSLSMGLLKVGAGVAAAATIGKIAMNAYKNSQDESLSAGGAIWKTLTDNIGSIAGAVIGGAIGSLGGPAGIAMGAAYGSQLGGMVDSPMNDGIITRPINDGIGSGLGKDFSKNRGIIDNGRITPIDNKDDLMAFKPNGPIDKKLSEDGKTRNVKIEFGTINFKFDDLKVVNTNGGSVSLDVLRDQNFIRNITTMIHSETEKIIQGGKNKG